MSSARSRNPGRSQAKVQDHDAILKDLVAVIEAWRWTNIKADHIGYPNGVPDQIKGSRPDVTAKNKNGTKFVFEVETVEALDTEHTKGQLQDFTSATAHVFLVMQDTYVENGQTEKSLPLVQRVLKKWGLEDKVGVGLQTQSGYTWYQWSNGGLVPLRQQDGRVAK